jgi:hypothetical protein
MHEQGKVRLADSLRWREYRWTTNFSTLHNIVMKKSKKKAAPKKISPQKTSEKSAQTQLDTFLDKYTPEIATMARSCLRKMRARLPGAMQLVYDNYNALAIGFSPSERPSEGIFSIVVFPRYVTLFFLQGTKVPDPKKLLQGSGNVVRTIRLERAADLDQPDVQELISAALKSAKVPIDHSARGKLIVRAILAKQRPRRPTK